ncbi:hypothetical protein D3C86_1074190 [compost metagenome]
MVFLTAAPWPPGFMILEGWMLKLFGGDAPIVLIMLVLACAMLATMMATQRCYLSRFIKPSLAGVAPFLIFLFPMPRFFLFEPLGVVMSETFSVSFFMTATMLAADYGTLRFAVWAGLLFALAAYFRSQYEIFVLGLIGLGAIFALDLAWGPSCGAGQRRPSDVSQGDLRVDCGGECRHVAVASS